MTASKQGWRTGSNSVLHHHQAQGLHRRIAGAAIASTRETAEALTVNYDLRLALKTSFTGEDMLTTVLRATSITDLQRRSDVYGDCQGRQPAVGIGRLYYTFLLAISLHRWSSVARRLLHVRRPATYHPSDLLLDFFTYGGAPLTNNLAGALVGAGVGATYPIGDTGFTVSGNYVAGNTSAQSSTVGIAGEETASTSSWQLFYEGEAFDGNLLASVGYSFDQNIGIAIGTSASTADRNSYSIAAGWKPADSGLIPSISTGYSASDVEVGDDLDSWYVGLEWSDVFIEGNSFGAAIGSAPSTEALDNTMWEMFYSFAVTDNITVTPAIFGIDEEGAAEEEFGGIVKTTFTF